VRRCNQDSLAIPLNSVFIRLYWLVLTDFTVVYEGESPFCVHKLRLRHLNSAAPSRYKLPFLIDQLVCNRLVLTELLCMTLNGRSVYVLSFNAAHEQRRILTLHVKLESLFACRFVLSLNQLLTTPRFVLCTWTWSIVNYNNSVHSEPCMLHSNFGWHSEPKLQMFGRISNWTGPKKYGFTFLKFKLIQHSRSLPNLHLNY